MRIVSVVGWHNSGKTTVVESMIVALRARGWRVATIKHSGGGFDLDHEGTDTWRYAAAGSDVIALAGHGQVAVIERREQELTLADLLRRLPSDVDVVLVEGFKREHLPKIEVLRKGGDDRRIASAEDLVALVSDDEDLVGEGVAFELGDTEALIEHLVARGVL